GEEDVHLPQKNASASKAGSYASPASQTPSLQGTKGCYEAPRGLGDIHKIWIMDYCKKIEWKPLDELGEKYLPEHWRKFGKDAERYGMEEATILSYVNSLILFFKAGHQG
ncbi:hypothetical protein DRN93_05605, partial [archaeon]